MRYNWRFNWYWEWRQGLSRLIPGDYWWAHEELVCNQSAKGGDNSAAVLTWQALEWQTQTHRRQTTGNTGKQGVMALCMVWSVCVCVCESVVPLLCACVWISLQGHVTRSRELIGGGGHIRRLVLAFFLSPPLISNPGLQPCGTCSFVCD